MTTRIIQGDARAVLAESQRDLVRARSAHVIRDIFAEHFPGPVSVLDVTYGPGGCWRWPYQAAGITLTTSDINPAIKADRHWDFRFLPLVPMWDVIVFDPPFTAAGHSVWSDRYGICREHGGPKNTQELGVWLMAGTKSACEQALRGVIIKYKDCVESGKMAHHWDTINETAHTFGWKQVDEWRTYGERPQPEGRTYTTKVDPTRYRVFKPDAAPLLGRT